MGGAERGNTVRQKLSKDEKFCSWLGWVIDKKRLMSVASSPKTYDRHYLMICYDPRMLQGSAILAAGAQEMCSMIRVRIRIRMRNLILAFDPGDL